MKGTTISPGSTQPLPALPPSVSAKEGNAALGWILPQVPIPSHHNFITTDPSVPQQHIWGAFPAPCML